MGQLLLFVVVAVVVAAIVFGVTVMVSGGDSGLTPVEPDGRSLPLPSDRPLGEEDVLRTRFDTAFRGYRMSQVDQALQRAAYDIGYKSELIGVLEAEVTALREGRTADADVLRRAREAAVAPPPEEPVVVPDVISSDDKDGSASAGTPAAPVTGRTGAEKTGAVAAGTVEPGTVEAGAEKTGAEKTGTEKTGVQKPATDAAPARTAGDEEPAESR